AALGLAYLLDLQPAWQAAATNVFFGRATEPSTRIAIVGMDARSHQALVGNRPTAAYPREVFAALADRLSAAGARVIVFDVLFELLVNFAGGPARDGRGAFPVLSLVDVVDGTADLAAVRDRIVFVGPWSARSSDEREGPSGTLFGVEIHANAAETLLRGNFLVPAPRSLTLASIALLAVVVALLVWRVRPLWAGLGALALLGAYFVVASEAFQHGAILN